MRVIMELIPDSGGRWRVWKDLRETSEEVLNPTTCASGKEARNVAKALMPFEPDEESIKEAQMEAVVIG